jgi:DNA-binding MarR family transcriptional regulator
MGSHIARSSGRHRVDGSPSSGADRPGAGTAPWLDAEQLVAWKRLVAVVELVPTVLDAQLRRDSALTHFEYFVLAMLSEAPERTLRMTALAQQTNASLTRLSHVVRRLEERGVVGRFPCPQDGRATDVRLTDDGYELLTRAAPGHVGTVRENVIDALSPTQVSALSEIAAAILRRIDPDGRLAGVADQG